MIEVRGLSFTYAGRHAPAVREASFDVAAGEIFGFLGPSGAGKSTMQKVLIRLLREYRGEVRVFGRNLSDWGSDYYERVGVSFEQPNHYLKLTARENLDYFRSLYAGSTNEPAQLLDRVGLGESADVRVSQLSKGMRNRLTVARSLLNRPTLLFLDEPTAGLDPVNARNIKDLIQEQREGGATVFLTTHDMWTADQLCDRVAFIVDGHIALIDSPRRLKLSRGKRTVRVEYQRTADEGRPTSAQRDFDLDGLGDDAEFLELLRSRRIETLHTLEATLENIFIDVTGRSLT